MDIFAIAIFVNNKQTIIKKNFIFIKYLKLYNSFYSDNTKSQPAPHASPAFFNASSIEPPANKVS